MLLRTRVHFQWRGQRLLLDQPEWLPGDYLWPGSLPHSAGEPYWLSVHHAELLLRLLRTTYQWLAGPTFCLQGPRCFSLLEYILAFFFKGYSLRGVFCSYGLENSLRKREWRSEKEYMGDSLSSWYICSSICVWPPSRSDRFPADFARGRANHICLSNMGRSWYDDCSEECTMGMPLWTKMAAADVSHVPLLWLVVGLSNCIHRQFGQFGW